MCPFLPETSIHFSGELEAILAYTTNIIAEVPKAVVSTQTRPIVTQAVANAGIEGCSRPPITVAGIVNRPTIVVATRNWRKCGNGSRGDSGEAIYGTGWFIGIVVWQMPVGWADVLGSFGGIVISQDGLSGSGGVVVPDAVRCISGIVASRLVVAIAGGKVALADVDAIIGREVGFLATDRTSNTEILSHPDSTRFGTIV